MRRVLARKAEEIVQPQAWSVDDTGFPKDGPAYPGVARQYSGSLGKVGTRVGTYDKDLNYIGP